MLHVFKNNKERSITYTVVKMLCKCVRFIVFFIFLIYYRVFLKGTIIGKKNIPEKGCFLAFNHVSYLDWLLTYALLRIQFGIKLFFVGNKKLLNTFNFRMLIYGTGTIDIDPNYLSSIRKAYKEMKGHLQEGNFIGIFPEGERSPNGKLLKAKDGIANLLFHINVPVVPIGLIGFYEAWPYHKKFPGLGRCTIKIGKPLYFRTTDYENKRIGKSIIINIIMNKIAQLTGDTYDYAHLIRKESDTKRVLRSYSLRKSTIKSTSVA